jgi:hypothetical protein
MRSLRKGMCHKKKIPKNIFVPRDIVPEYEYGGNVMYHRYDGKSKEEEKEERKFRLALSDGHTVYCTCTRKGCEEMIESGGTYYTGRYDRVRLYATPKRSITTRSGITSAHNRTVWIHRFVIR